MTTEPGSKVASRNPLAEVSLEVILAGQSANGAFIASPAFAQYRYAWFRDGSFIAEGLDIAGHLDAAAQFHDWVADVVIGARDGIERSIDAAMSGRSPAPDDYLHCRYELDGTPGPDDWPTFQLDGPGIWLWSLAHHAKAGGALRSEHRDAALLAARYLAALWEHPSYDAWEESPTYVHTSTLAAILAGLRAAPELLAGPVDPAIRLARAGIEERLMGHAGALTKWDGADAVDGSLLWIVAPYGLMDPVEPAFAATLRRIEADLVSPAGGVHRYAADTFYGGGEWPLLTAALGRVYLRRGEPGDRQRAQRCLRWIEAQAGPDGSLPEQVANHALHPERIAEWRALWGESASPLLWSHATYLALLTEFG
jgi:GH15 family glucan-1,4-alpha-glucosidase